MISHQFKQHQVINQISNQVSNNSLGFTTVFPVNDFEADQRICLTSVHFPDKELIEKVRVFIESLRELEPTFFFYPDDSFHLTIKNVRVISNPPNFTEIDVQKANQVFSETIPLHKQFQVYFYRLLLFPNNLSLIGTTDPELDKIILDLDKGLKKAGIPDDKVYANSKYFFSNMTLARFNSKPSQEFEAKILELSESLTFQPYMVDSVTLVTGNAVLKKRHKIGTWKLS
ncbi:MAG: hypothetical protein GF381_04325 [Candidatus Pacebacteria bacterium]|nr:hypothetical protein [Candidatus Paceibacterota bacterium]